MAKSIHLSNQASSQSHSTLHLSPGKNLVITTTNLSSLVLTLDFDDNKAIGLMNYDNKREINRDFGILTACMHVYI